MREIKFRAWDKQTKEMVAHEHLGIHAGQAGYLASGPVEFWSSSDLILMQYTGLKDKNGVEIYEGDILRFPPQSRWDEKNYSAFEVFYHNNDSTPTDCGLVLGRMKSYGSVAGGYCGYKLIPRYVGSMQVIGNIYENPELME